MQSTVKLGRLYGIPIGLHWSIALVAALLTATLTGSILPAAAPGQAGVAYLLTGLATAGLFLASIVAHELGHSIVAKNNGVGVKRITLFALGGVAVLEDESPSAGAAGRIALAGPAVSVLVGVVSLVTGFVASSLGLPALIGSALVWLGVINLALAAFNMIPALPLDGGRVLQAYLWHRRGERHQATISAARLGRYLGWAMVAVGLWQFTQGGAGLWTVFIGWFVVTAARTESRHAKRQLRASQRPVGSTGIPFIDLLVNQPGRPFPGEPLVNQPAPPTGPTRTVIDVEGRLVE